MLNRELLEKLAENVLLKSGMMSESGLVKGKMGAVLFLMHYARYTGKEVYEEYAGLLLDDIMSGLHVGLPVNMENGLCGIGWGIEYLLQNHFVEGDADEILPEIDEAVMERDPVRIKDKSLGTGLMGILEYALIRLRPRKTEQQRRLFDPDYWRNLKKAASLLLLHTENQDQHRFAELFLTGIEQPEIIPERKISDIISFEVQAGENLWQRSDGLRGNSGLGLKMLLEDE